MGLHNSSFLIVVFVITLSAGIVGAENSADDKVTDDFSQEGVEELPFYAAGPVARINREEIGPDVFNELVQRQVGRMAMEVEPHMVPMFKEHVLDNIINQYLIDVELEESDIEVTTQAVFEKFIRFRARLENESITFEQQLEMMNMSKEEVLVEMREMLKIEQLLAQSYDVEITDEEVRAFFEENKQHFSTEDQVHGRHILIQLSAGASEEEEAKAQQRATKIYEETSVDGADFQALARDHSDGPTAEQGGDLGYFQERDMVPAFSAVAFNMEPGNISEPVRTRFGFHIIQIVDTKKGESGDFDEVRDQIKYQLEEQRFQRVFVKYVEALKANAEIERLEGNIEVNLHAPGR